MSRQYEDRDSGYRELIAELQEKRFRAQHDPEYLTRLRSREGDSFSSEDTDSPCPSSSDTLDSSDSSSPEASDSTRWEWCAGAPTGQTRMHPRSSKPTRGRWQRMLRRFGKLVLP